MVHAHLLGTPAPYDIKPRSQDKKQIGEKWAKVHNQPRLHEVCRTMPSIPEKIIVFQAEQIEEELKRQISNFNPKKNPRHSTSTS
jgi:hypothetical protein